MSERAWPQILVVADGPAISPATNSGVARGVTEALSARGDVQVIPTRGVVPSGLSRAALAALTYRPSKRLWRQTFSLGFLNIAIRSLSRNRIAARNAGAVVLHVRNVYLPQRKPYAVFIDTTSALVERGWTGWRLPPVLRLIRRRCERLYFRKATWLFTAGQEAAASVVEDYGVEPGKVLAVGAGVNFSPFPKAAALSTSMRILWVGKDFERKGGDILLRAFSKVRAEVNRAELVLVGDSRDVVQDGVISMGIVEDRQTVEEIYRSARVFCLPARYEPFGLVVPEAMAFGLPCVVSSVGELNSIVVDGSTGAVVEQAEDVDKLAAALLTYLRDYDLAAQTGAAARARALESYTWARVAERIAHALHDFPYVAKN